MLAEGSAILTKRILSSVFLIGIVPVGIMNGRFCGVLVTLFVICGLYEFFRMLEHKGISMYKYFGIGMGAIIPMSIAFRFELTKSWELLFIVLAVLALILMQFKRRAHTGVVVDISTTLFGILYVAWFLSFLIKIRYLPGGAGLLTLILMITKLGDIGAYLIGMRFGRTPLIPRISPKKSVEGALGGLLFSILGALAGGTFLGFSRFNPLHLCAMGVFFGVLGQLGDLSESLMKRDCHIKDSGGIFPGIGGTLDAVDSLLFTAPVFYFYMSVVLKP